MFDQLAVTKMTPKPGGNRQPERSDRAVAAYAQLEPADDQTAEAPSYPLLGLLPADVERLKDLAEAVAEQRQMLTDAEAALSNATREAAKLTGLRSRAGEIAAAAFGANGHGLEMAANVTQQISIASNAQSALPTLQKARDHAFDRLGELKGALRREACGALKDAMRRAAARYSMLVLELTRAVSGLEAAYRALPAAVQEPLAGAFDIGWLPNISLPDASAFGAKDPAAAEINFRSMTLCPSHPRLLAHTSAARGYLYTQLQEAVAPSGIAVSTLLA